MLAIKKRSYPQVLFPQTTDSNKLSLTTFGKETINVVQSFDDNGDGRLQIADYTKGLNIDNPKVNQQRILAEKLIELGDSGSKNGSLDLVEFANLKKELDAIPDGQVEKLLGAGGSIASD